MLYNPSQMGLIMAYYLNRLDDKKLITQYFIFIQEFVTLETEVLTFDQQVEKTLGAIKEAFPNVKEDEKELKYIVSKGVYWFKS
jgi:hypothetical protein